MIVRDAESSLGKALESVREFVDEIVVVDTGSTDRTSEVARDFGGKLYDFAWCDDFSAARNFSIEQATGSWILWVDADDVLPPDSGQEIRRLVAEHPRADAAFWVTVEEQAPATGGGTRVMGHAHLKVFPRHPEIRFQYRVHEQISPAIRKLGLPLKTTSAVVEHRHADRSPVGERNRLQRNLRLLELDLRDRPQDPVVLMNLGATYLFSAGEVPRSIDFLRRSLDRFAAGSTTQLNAYLYLGQAYGTLGNRNAELKTYAEALELFPNDAALLLRLANTYEQKQQFEQAVECYQTALARGKLRLSSVHVRNGPAYAVLRLGHLYVKLGRPLQAEQLWQRFLSANPPDSAIRQALTELRLQPRTIIVRS